MKKYLHLVLFPLLLGILWALFIEYFHVFQNVSRVYHWTLIFPLLFLLWATLFTKEHRIMLRALGYMFRHHSRELMWHEVYESLEGKQASAISLIIHIGDDPKRPRHEQVQWKPVWTDADRNLVDIKNATTLACQQIIQFYIEHKASLFEKRMYRRWKTGGASDIYIIASFLNVL